MNKILMNGSIIDRDSCIDIEDRGYQFGDGIYEVVGVYNGSLFLMEEHIKRLQRSARELSIPLPFSIEKLKEDLQTLTEMNKIQEGLVYFQVTRGVAPRSHELPQKSIDPIVVAYTQALDDLTELQDEGSIAILHEDIRWLRCDIKTLNLLPNTMAKQKAVEHGAVEAILHRGDTVTEASSSNVFIIKNGTVYTHPANNYILNGITRQKIIELLEKLHIPVKEEQYTVDELLEADEVFITATKLDVVPINSIDGKNIGSGTPGTLTMKILEAMRSVTNQL